MTMQTLQLECFLEEVEQRKAEVGLDESPAAVDSRRNKGARRTEAKRALLRRSEQRATATGLRAVPSYY
jgi:hypothetical protein